MIDFHFSEALECPQSEFDEFIARLNEELRYCVDDYVGGLVRLEDVGICFDQARKCVHNALSHPFRLNEEITSQLRYRCGSDEAFGNLLDDYSRWKDGMPPVEHPDEDWLFAYAGDRDGKSVFAPVACEQRARLFRLCDTCAYSVRRFAHAFDGIEVPRYHHSGYGTGSYYRILEDFADDGGFLNEPDPVGKTFRICSGQGTEGEATPFDTGVAHFGGADAKYYKASGYVEGYVDTEKNSECEIELFGHGTGRLMVAFYRYNNKATVRRELPLEAHERWQPYREAKAKFDQWVNEDEKPLLQRRLGEIGFGEYSAHIADCVYGSDCQSVPSDSLNESNDSLLGFEERSQHENM